MTKRRHSNNTGYRRIKNGNVKKDVQKMAAEMRVPYGRPHEKINYCQFCQDDGVVGESLFLYEDMEKQGGKVYMCKTCEDKEIERYEDDYINYPCDCSPNQAGCLQRGCRGMWT